MIAVWGREGAGVGESVCVYWRFRSVASVRQDKGGGRRGIHQTR